MTRWLAIAALLFAVPAQAQVFKPGKSSTSGSSSSSSSKSSSSGSTAKKSSTGTSAKKSSGKKGSSKKKSAVSKGHPGDLTPDDAPKVDPDYVKIIDDDE